MLFNEQVLFIHIPKTGGMSCANFLLRALRGPVYSGHRGADKDPARFPRREIRPLTTVNRHCTLKAARRHLLEATGTALKDLDLILAVIRHPFSLEYSFYRYLRQMPPQRRARHPHPEQLLLADGDFRAFVAGAGYLRPGLRQEDYVLLDGVLPAKVQLVRFEEMASALPALVAPYSREDAPRQLPHRNPSAGEDRHSLARELDQETRALIYRKHRYLFDQGYYSPDEAF